MAQITTTASTIKIQGKNTPVVTAPTRSTPYYRLAYMSLIRGGVTVNVLKTINYSGSIQSDIDNLSCWDTFDEVQAFATSVGISAVLKDPQV